MSTPLDPAGPRYLAVADELRNRILVGTYSAGARLPGELELARTLGVARTSVREALRVLASQGMVETTRGGAGGTVVRELDHRSAMAMVEDNIRFLAVSSGCTEQEMEEVREILEVTATWMAASRRTPVQVERLRACIPELPAGEVPTAAQIETNLRFHYEILEATGNRLLHLFSQPVTVMIYSFYRRAEHTPEYYQDVLTEHRRILRAIEARDADAARRAMSEHFCSFRGGTASSLRGLTFD